MAKPRFQRVKAFGSLVRYGGPLISRRISAARGSEVAQANIAMDTALRKRLTIDRSISRTAANVIVQTRKGAKIPFPKLLNIVQQEELSLLREKNIPESDIFVYEDELAARVRRRIGK